MILKLLGVSAQCGMAPPKISRSGTRKEHDCWLGWGVGAGREAGCTTCKGSILTIQPRKNDRTRRQLPGLLAPSSKQLL